MQAAIQSLQLQIVLSLPAGEPSQKAAVPHVRIHYRPSVRKTRARVFQGLLELWQGELPSDIGKIGSVRSSLLSHNVT